MNYHLTIALIVFSTIIGSNAYENGKIREARIQVKVPKIVGIKPENVPILVNLMVKAFLGSPKCHQERKETTNFYVENGKCLITDHGLKLLTEGKNLCKIQLQMSQLNKQNSLKRDLEVLSKGKSLWDGFMTDYWGHNSVKAIRGELVASILNEFKVIIFGVSKAESLPYSQVRSGIL
jgi:hypothetical protein